MYYNDGLFEMGLDGVTNTKLCIFVINRFWLIIESYIILLNLLFCVWSGALLQDENAKPHNML